MSEPLERRTLREWRQVRSLDAVQLAVAADITLSTVYRIEQGKQTPLYVTMQKLAKALGVEADQIIWPDTPPKWIGLGSRTPKNPS